MFYFIEEVANVALQEIYKNQISVCVFESLESMTKSVMENPGRALCFQDRFWTVGLIGTSDWASNLIEFSGDGNLYNAVSTEIKYI